MACIDIDVVDYIDEISDKRLLREVKDRVAAGKYKPGDMRFDDGGEPWAPHSLACDIREAFYRRDASEMERLLRVLEQRSATP